MIVGAAATLTVKPKDDSTYSSRNNELKMNSTAVEFGDHLGSGLPSVLIAGFQYWLDEDSHHGESHLRSLAWSSVLVQTMKFSIGRSRPGGSENRQSFPSGHTTVSFTTATSLAYAYGWKAAVVAYPAAAFVGVSRLAKGTHWLSDVVAGVFIGYWMGRAGFYDYQLSHDQSLTIYPAVDPEESTLNLTYSF